MLNSSLSVFRRHLITTLASTAALIAGGSGLFAAPLEKPACDRLQAEKQTLIVLGVDKEFSKGPDWAKANLVQSELNLVKRYLDLEEQLKFRCGMAVVTLQPVQEEPEDGPDDDADTPSNAPAPKRREAKPAAKPAEAPVKAVPAAPAAKPAPKAPAKAQSSWNTQTAPVEAVSPSAVEPIDVAPRQNGRRQRETGG
jgi:hypothetical protein